jgi:cobalt-zinc-cadmium efflux system outer membrane protein
VRLSWEIAMSSLLLMLVVVGCQSAPPFRPAIAERTSDAPSNSPAKPALELKTDDRVTLARFVQSEPPAPSVEEGDAPCVLTLAELEEIALQHNPTLSAAAARTKAARGRQVQAGLYPNPVVAYHGTEIGNEGTAGQQGALVSQRIVTGGKLRLDRAIAGKEVDEAHFRFHAQQWRVLSDVRVRFYNALVAQRRVELAKELARIGDELVAATEKLVEGRLATENDLLQAEIRADQSHILLDNAGNQQVEAWQRLAAVAGVPTMQTTPLVGELDADLPSLDWGSCYAALLSSSPELKAARARVAGAGIAAERARREAIPNVDLAVSVRHHNVTHDDVANVQLGIPLPVFNRNQGNAGAAEAEWIAASNEVERIELDLQDRLAVAFRRYADARQQVDRYGQRIVPRARKSLELVTEGYQNGQVPYLSLLTSQQTHLEVNLSYLESLQELRTASALIEGHLLNGSLAGRP